MNVHDEINGALYKIHRPARGKSAEEIAQREMTRGETVTTSFPSMGESIISEVVNASGDVRGEMAMRKHAPLICRKCMMPAHAHQVFGGEIVHEPDLVDIATRTPGVSPGVERLPRKTPEDVGAPQMAVEMTEDEFEAAATKWARATARQQSY